MKEKQGHKKVIISFQIEIITKPRVKTCVNIGGSKTIKSMLLTSDNSNSLNLLLLVRKKILRCMKDLKHIKT